MHAANTEIGCSQLNVTQIRSGAHDLAAKREACLGARAVDHRQRAEHSRPARTAHG